LRLRQYYDELEEHSEGLAKIELALPQDADFPSFFFLLQEICSQNGAVLTGISPSLLPPKTISEAAVEEGSEGGTEREKRVLSTSIGVTGSYDVLFNLLSALERSARLIEVTSISFSSPAENDPFSFGLSLQAYSY